MPYSWELGRLEARIAVIDNDGQSEIVVINNNYAYGTKTGVTVYGDKDKSWRPARKIWNQHAYYITNMVRLS